MAGWTSGPAMTVLIWRWSVRGWQTRGDIVKPISPVPYFHLRNSFVFDYTLSVRVEAFRLCKMFWRWSVRSWQTTRETVKPISPFFRNTFWLTDKLFFNGQLVLFMVALCAYWLAMVVLRLPLQNNGCTSCELVGNGCASLAIAE